MSLGFSSGEQELDRFLYKSVPQYHENNAGITYVAVHVDKPELILGYHYFCAAALPHDTLGAQKLTHTHHYPVLKFHTLAVDSRQKKKGIGALLFFEGLDAAHRAAPIIGLHGVYFEALDSARTFYSEYLGLKPIAPSKTKFFLSIDDIARLLAA